MSLALIYSRARLGIDAPLVTVEVHLSNGLPGLSIVGLPETAVKESKDRVRSAILNSHLEFPARRITVNLAPADLPKEGGRFDLAIALGILAASGQIPAEGLENYEFIAELALSGDTRQVDAALPAALACGRAGHQLIIATANAAEAALSRQTRVYPADSLLQVCAHLHQREFLFQHSVDIASLPPQGEDLREVKGQYQAKRALEVAAAGGHNLLFYGPPGTGKSMLAHRLPGILPPLDEDEAIEVAALYSITSSVRRQHWFERPFRSPHHTTSAIALAGGGSNPRPGEISLAHHGVLFLDELPEFSRAVLEVLREPLENGAVSISRARAQVVYPARFQLIAAMNPCPCGYHGSERCQCSGEQVRRYRQKISGPLLDRIDMHIPVRALKSGEIHQPASGDSSELIRQRVIAARARQMQRQGKLNRALSGAELERYVPLDAAGQQLLDQSMEKLGLSARAMHRVLKLALTLADLQQKDRPDLQCLAEALGYRTLDRVLHQ